MGNTTSNLLNYKERIQKGIPLIKEWLNKQEDNIKEKEEFKEVERVIKEIEIEEDFSKDAFLDIRFILKPFDETIPLQIKRIFNVSTLDNYTTFIASRWFETIEDFINLELSTSKYQGNMTKFHYNPIPLTVKTRELFDHLQTLYLYSEKDELFEDDKRIIKRKRVYLNEYFEDKEMNQLEEWTRKECEKIVFDSNVDNWYSNETLNSRVMNRNHLIFLIEDQEGQKFGGYINSKIDKAHPGGGNGWELGYAIEDPNAFVFSLNSNGRMNRMMKFNIENETKALMLNDSNDSDRNWLFLIGRSEKWNIKKSDICVYKKSNKSLSYCRNNNFNYGNIENALIGRDDQQNNFIPKRFVVIQMI